MKKNSQAPVQTELPDEVALVYSLGETLHVPELKERFSGVLEDILREIRGGMCTPEQGYAYLENFELRLLAEQIGVEEELAEST